MVPLVLVTLAAGLLIDRYGGEYGQAVTVALVWIVFALLLRRARPEERLPFAACIAIATAGEIVLSLGWGLYQYRLGNIPLFVPPGHVLLFFLGLRLADRLPPATAWGIAALGLPFVAYEAWTGLDTSGPFLFGFYLLCLAHRRRTLYASMFLVALALELYGTWVGTWRWMPEAPGLGLAMQNPPFAVGAFYCVLDLLVVGIVSRFGGRPLFVRRHAREPRTGAAAGPTRATV